MTAPKSSPTLAAYLNIPLYLLAHVRDIDAFPGLSPDQLARLPQEYEQEELAKIMEALQFAKSHPDFDFRSLVGNVPFTNEQIHRFLCRVLASMVAGQPEN
ncbi:MAG: hypothetical protein JF606_12360 [Burkholderiales bacterium]|jgi:hypothetical protein|nr:hypothetical protein [Burkholderiales bacterium]